MGGTEPHQLRYDSTEGKATTSNPLAGIEHEHPLKQVHGAARHGGEPHAELLLGVLRQGPHVSAGVVAPEEPEAGVVRKQGLSGDHLAEDAAHGPHVDGLGVLGAVEQELRRPVPPRDDVLHHEVGLRRGPRQPEVPNLQVALGVQQHVARPQVPVQDVRRVHVLEPAEQLVHEVLHRPVVVKEEEKKKG